MGRAGEGRDWHHIVEQHGANLQKFGAEAIQNPTNLLRVARDVHQQISAHYSSKTIQSGTQTVREWLKGQSYEAQRDYGLKLLKEFGVIK
jgi:hypothetical protein